MSDITKTVRAEILRLAAKEAKAQVAKAERTVAQYRQEIARLKRLLAQREKEIRHLKKHLAEEPEDNLAGVRFSAKSVRSQRRRLGLSAEDYGKLIGVSALTVFNWEKGKSRPRRAQLVRLVAVRGISKREALAKLSQ